MGPSGGNPSVLNANYPPPPRSKRVPEALLWGGGDGGFREGRRGGRRGGRFPRGGCRAPPALEGKCKSVVIATRGGGLGPHHHDGTSPLAAYTTLAPAFFPNVSRNEKEGPKTNIDCLDTFLQIHLRMRVGPWNTFYAFT